MARNTFVFSSRTEPTQIGRLSVAVYCLTLVAVSIYFLPIWLGFPLTKQAWQAHMWISNYGNWI